MTRTIQLTYDAHDPLRLGLFWRAALDYAVDPPPGGTIGEPEETVAAWMDFLRAAGVPEERHNSAFALVDPDGAGPRIFFQQVPEDKVAKNRLHVDVRAAPGLTGDERMAALERECERLVALGATRQGRHEPDGGMQVGHIVMTDPEGNEFCLD
jgi:catechol 2,3-dioxygenase-like lactoylglutathione lyase family enzyme